ncbi:hypothetical protein BH23CHL5_BH23CHL5_02880 [soil metagenome]
MSSSRSFRRRWAPFLLVVGIVFIPALTVMATIGADRLGYCVNNILPGELGLNVDPYVQNVADTEASVLWRSAAEKSGIIRWEGSNGEVSEIELKPDRLQVARLIDLEPATQYAYTVSIGELEFEGTVTTAPPATASVTIGALGDSGTASRAQYDVAAQLRLASPDLVLHTGDVVYRRGALCHYGPKFFAPYGEMIRHVPVYPVIGNHDLMAADGRAYFESFDLPSEIGSNLESYYSFDYGPVHFVSLSSELYEKENLDDAGAQKTWLEADLADNDRPWTIVTIHRPPYSSTSGKASDSVRNDLVPILEAFEVDLVLSGHAHNYERTNQVNGVVYIVTGGGGADLYDVGTSEWTAHSAREHHFVKIDASPNALDVVAISRDGNILDQISIER